MNFLLSVVDSVLDGIDGWAMRLLTNGAAGSVPAGEVRITGGDA